MAMFCDHIRDARRSIDYLSYLDNDVLDTVGHAETLAFNDTLVALTNQTLVRVDGNTDHTSLVVGQGRDLSLIRLHDSADKTE